MNGDETDVVQPERAGSAVTAATRTRDSARLVGPLTVLDPLRGGPGSARVCEGLRRSGGSWV